MLKEFDQKRLEKLKHDIAALTLRFPTTTIARRAGFDKGNVCRMLKGKIPCSDKFLNQFYLVFRTELQSAAMVRDEKAVHDMRQS